MRYSARHGVAVSQQQIHRRRGISIPRQGRVLRSYVHTTCHRGIAFTSFRRRATAICKTIDHFSNSNSSHTCGHLLCIIIALRYSRTDKKIMLQREYLDSQAHVMFGRPACNTRVRARVYRVTHTSASDGLLRIIPVRATTCAMTSSASAVFAAPGKPSREALKNSLSRLHWKLSTCEAHKRKPTKVTQLNVLVSCIRVASPTHAI